jgi:hypothetical protein
MRTVLFKRTPLIVRRTLIWCLACCVNVLMAPAAAAQDGRLEVELHGQGRRHPGSALSRHHRHQEHQPAGARALAAGMVGRLVHDRELREPSFAFESPNRAAGNCGLRSCASRPGESTRGGSRASLSSSISGRSFAPPIRRASRRTTRSSPARSSSFCPRVIHRDPVWCASMFRAAGESPAEGTAPRSRSRERADSFRAKPSQDEGGPRRSGSARHEHRH